VSRALLQEYRGECDVMNEIIEAIDTQKRVTMSCIRNAQCTGYDCSGVYTYNGSYSGGSPFEVDFCFGMAIHPCSRPPNVHFYVQVPDKSNNAFNRNVNSSMQVRLSDVHYDMAQDIYQGDGYVQISRFDVGREDTWGGRQYIVTGMRFRMRLTVHVGPIRHETWPEDFEFDMMPTTKFPVPICNSTVITPTGAPGTCTNVTPAPSTTTVSTTTTTLSPDYTGSTKKPQTRTALSQSVTTNRPADSHFLKECHPDSIGQCGENQMCVPIPGTKRGKGLCDCQVDYERHPDTNECHNKWNSYIVIEPNDIPLTPEKHTKSKNKPYDIPQTPEKHNKSNGNTMIIVGSVIGGVAIVGIILSFVIYKYKKHQAQYSQHELLLNNEDDDDPISVT